MKDKKICFITAVNNELAYEECLFYIDNLCVPQGYEIEKIAIRNAESMCEAYNKACKKTNAKYKVYLHQDVFIINKNFIYDILEIFKDYEVGMIGVCGAISMPLSGVWWESENKIGKVYENSKGRIELLDFDYNSIEKRQVEAIDGLIMVTQYDIPWRDDLFDGWHFYDITQSKEFINAGYKVIVPKQYSPWCIHECGIVKLKEFEKYKKIYLHMNKEELINNKIKKNSETIIAIGLDNKLLENIKEGFVKITLNENIEQVNTYYNDKNIVYETNLNNLKSVIKEIIKEYYNKYAIIFSDYKLGQFIDKKENCKLIYYTDINLSTDKKDYLNQNINIYFEKEICDKVDFIFTSNIIVYCFKNLIEKRKNVYFVNEDLDLNNQIYLNNQIIEELSWGNISNNLKNISNEYLKAFYRLILSKNNTENYIESIKNIYSKYDTEESYKLYISFLNDLKRYNDMLFIMINSNHGEDIYIEELKYLVSIKNNDLIEFIINMSIKNYKYIDLINDNNLNYKMALYLYELMQFYKAYEKYIDIINQNEVLRESPLVNRNISFLMYKNNDYRYEEYYDKYKKIYF